TGVWGLHPAGHSFLLEAGAGWKYGDVGHANADAGPGSMLGHALESPPVVAMDDLRTDTRFPAPEILSDHDVVSGVNVLIPVRYQPFGVLGVYTTEARSFTADEVQSLVAVAAVLATAIDRNRADSG